jgi:hypothetical protein
MKFLFFIFVMTNIVFAIKVIQLLHEKMNPKPPNPCDNCIHLKERRSPNSGNYRYDCSKRGAFDYPPEYCAKREIKPNKKTLSANEANWEYFGDRIWDEESEEWFCAQCKNLLADGYRCTQCTGEE